MNENIRKKAIKLIIRCDTVEERSNDHDFRPIKLPKIKKSERVFKKAFQG